MNLSSYLIEYTLKNVFGGNKSAYARAIGMDDSNFRRVMKVVQSGKGSAHLMEQTLEMGGLSVEEFAKVLTEYMGLAQSNGRCNNESVIFRIKTKLSAHAEHMIAHQAHSEILLKAEALLLAIQSVYCDKNECQYDSYRQLCIGCHGDGFNDDLNVCPCKHLEELLESLNIPAID